MTGIIAWLKGNWAIALTVAWLIGGLSLLSSSRVWDWQVLTAVATWVLAGGVFLAILQIYQARKSTNAQIAVELFRELRIEGSKDTLRLIYNRLGANTNYIGIEKIKIQVNGLLDKFEMLGNLVDNGIIDPPLAIEAYGGPPALRCWYCLAKYIRAEERKRGYFLQHYEAFVRRCLDYFREEKVEIKFHKEGSSEPPEDLLQFSGDLVQFFGSLNTEDERYPRRLEDIKRARKKHNKKGV